MILDTVNSPAASKCGPLSPEANHLSVCTQIKKQRHIKPETPRLTKRDINTKTTVYTGLLYIL
jgi:hypothetical protein